LEYLCVFLRSARLGLAGSELGGKAAVCVRALIVSSCHYHYHPVAQCDYHRATAIIFAIIL